MQGYPARQARALQAALRCSGCRGWPAAPLSEALGLLGWSPTTLAPLRPPAQPAPCTALPYGLPAAACTALQTSRCHAPAPFKVPPECVPPAARSRWPLGGFQVPRPSRGRPPGAAPSAAPPHGRRVGKHQGHRCGHQPTRSHHSYCNCTHHPAAPVPAALCTAWPPAGPPTATGTQRPPLRAHLMLWVPWRQRPKRRARRARSHPPVPARTPAPSPAPPAA